MLPVLLLALLAPVAARAQAGVPEPVGDEVFAGSELERYLRVLQLTGEVPLYPWSARALSPREVDRLVPSDSLHPWAGRFRFRPEDAGPHFSWVRPSVQTIYNSGFPYGSNDGPVWAGRGLTTALQAGFSGRYGPLSLVVAPTLFRAENRSFELMPNGQAGAERYGDGLFWRVADVPQRFGDGAYTRLDPGQSTLRIDAGPVAAGFSTADQVWGPADEFPLVLGNNAAGFPHLFVGTAVPANIGIGQLHGRFVWGRLAQSEFSPMPAADGARLMTGLVLSFSPRWPAGLELGASRFYHDPWPDEGLVRLALRQPFEVLLKKGHSNQLDSIQSNQLASAFLRWVFPASGLEFYGEFVRDDHSWDLRDLILEPDHASGYMLGLQKVVYRSPQHLTALRGELLNSRATHLAKLRGGGNLYRHSQLRQGHTERGQLLAAPAGFGGAGALLATDFLSPRGRWSVEWLSQLRQVRPAGGPTTGLSGREDVTHGLTLQAYLFRGRFDVGGEIGGVYDLNRDFAGDAFNLRGALSASMRTGR